MSAFSNITNSNFFRNSSTGAIRFILQFKLVDLQLFSDWLILTMFSTISPEMSENFHFFKYIIHVKIFFAQYVSTSAFKFMLWFKVADLQLFSDWLILIFHYFTCKKWPFQLFQICYERYFFITYQLVLWDSCYKLKWLISSCFLIGYEVANLKFEKIQVSMWWNRKWYITIQNLNILGYAGLILHAPFWRKAKF